MSIFKKLMKPVIEHSVAIMDEEEKEVLLDRIFERMMNEMAFEDTINLFDKWVPRILESMSDQQKLQFLLRLLPKITDTMDWEKLSAMVQEFTNQNTNKEGVS